MYGLLEELYELEAYVLGNNTVPWIPYREDGNWESALPEYENQTTRLGQETNGCTSWGALNQLETFERGVYGREPNYSERFTYLNVPIDPKRGTDPQRTHEAIRAHGVIPESELPMTRSLSEYLDQSDITGSLRARGQYWLSRHTYKHEWLWKVRPANFKDILKDSLKTCPIAVSVTAWKEAIDDAGNLVYVSDSNNNHYCLLYKIDEDGYPWVFDSYDHSKKRLSKDHNIRRAKRIWLNKKTRPAMALHIRVLQAVVKALMKKRDLVDLVQAKLGTDVSPRDLAHDEVGCAESVTTLLKELYPETPIITGTYTLWEYLRDPKNGYERVTVPTPGCIIISPTGTGNGTGHVGIFTRENLIASNQSSTGRFLENYTLDVWLRTYAKLQTSIWKHV